ncbi:MAG: hypothetical protein WKF30_11355 [Pyrinomonadaceae bacterium]
MSDTPDHILLDRDGTNFPGVRVTIEVAGLKEVWEYPFGTSALQSALAAVEAVHMELNSRRQLAMELERDFGENPDAFAEDENV